MKNQCMIISFPRQGTDFILNCLSLSCNNFRYHREFFNPLSTLEEYKEKISTTFGCEDNPDKIFYYEEEKLEEVYEQTWKKTNFNITKEVYCCRKIPFYQKYFDLLAVYRHRINTFPTTKSEYILPIFDSFLNSKNEQNYTEEIKQYLKSLKNINNIKKQVLIHIVYWFMQFHYIQKYNISVLNYASLVNCEKKELIRHIDDNCSVLDNEIFNLDKNKFCENIISQRNVSIKEKRYYEYYKLGIEIDCINLLLFLENLKTGLEHKYLYMLMYVI